MHAHCLKLKMDKALRALIGDNFKKQMMKFYKNEIDTNYMLSRTSKSKLIEDKVFPYVRFPAQLEPVPIDIGKMKPLFTEKLLNYHQKKYVSHCVEKYNESVKKYFAENTPGVEHEKILDAINHYGGAIINMKIFWNTLSEDAEPKGPQFDLFRIIQRDFGTTSKMIDELKSTCMDIKGYGWGWLGFDVTTNGLSIASTPDEIPLQMRTGLLPLFGIDMWEHAYYLQYKNLKADYLNSVISRLNWKNASELLNEYQTMALDLNSKLD